MTYAVLLGDPDRLLNNPHAQPPLPSDWEVHPTYPRHATVPYFLAPLGDEMSSRQNKSERSEQRLHDGMGATKKITAEEERPPKVPQELRRKLKRAKSARGLLQELEQDIRRFVQDWEKHNNSRAPADDEARQIDSEDEEIVFVGRNGDMSDMLNPGEKSEGQPPKRDKLVIESLVEDRGASFRYASVFLLSKRPSNSATDLLCLFMTPQTMAGPFYRDVLRSSNLVRHRR